MTVQVDNGHFLASLRGPLYSTSSNYEYTLNSLTGSQRKKLLRGIDRAIVSWSNLNAGRVGTIRMRVSSDRLVYINLAPKASAGLYQIGKQFPQRWSSNT